MAVTLTADVLEDELAMSLARILATANKQAHQADISAAESFITISQRSSNGEAIWRVNYSAKDVVGRRCGPAAVPVWVSDRSASSTSAQLAKR